MLRRALLLLLVLPVLGIPFLLSCGKYDYYICSFDYLFLKQDTAAPLSGPMTIEMGIHHGYSQTCFAPIADFFVSRSYAMQPNCVNWLNAIDWSTVSLTFSRPLVIDGDTLGQGSNFLEHPLVNGKSKFVTHEACSGIYFDQQLPASLVSKITFDTGTYSVSLSCMTTDKRSITVSTITRFVK